MEIKKFRLRGSDNNLGSFLFIVIYHLFLFVALPLYVVQHGAPWKMIGVSFALMYVTGLSITMGYHRLYSHLAYKINPVVEAVLLFFGTMATQGSAIRWTFDHRYHHAFVDTDRDPYSIKKGFWYAHFFWMLEKQAPVDPKVVADLLKSPMLRFQDKYYGYLVVLTNVIALLGIGALFDNYYGAFIFGVLGRMFFLHHCTWFINSLAHTWGERPFCQELSAVDNYIIALLTFGEGYHNYHHTFAQDYRNGIRWYHFDPTKWLIWTLNKCGLAKQLRTVQNHQIQEKILADRKRILLEKLQTSVVTQKEDWEKKISTVMENVMIKLNDIKRVSESYRELKKNKTGKKDHLLALKLEVKQLKKAVNEEYRKWSTLNHDLSRLTHS